MPTSSPRLVATLASVVSISLSGSLSASDGYFDIGYGIKAKGMGGVGVALPQDSIAPAANPAGLALVDDRIDAGLTWFRPDRSSTLGDTTNSANGTKSFWIPEAGISRRLGEHLTAGLCIYGNGGMNTSYDKPIYPGSTSESGVNLMQMFVAPTLAWKPIKNHSFGISPLFAYQRFEAQGLEGFGIQNPGVDSSRGYGIRLGYTGRILDWLSVGATWQSRTYMSRFDKYSGLFAEQGDFDIPENFALGIAVKPFPGNVISCDVERIRYSKVAAIGNDLSMARFGAGLGADDGPGFGWQDVTVTKLGIAQDLSPVVTVRAGWNHCTQPIQEDQTYFNMLAPGVIQDHLTLGGTWAINPSLELSVNYVHAFTHTVYGSGNAFGPNTDANLTMSQDMVGIGLGWKG